MKQTRVLRLLLCIFLLLCLAVPCAAKTTKAGTDEVTAANPQELLNALKKGTSVIHVEDMTFEPGTKLFLNYDVQLIGKKEKSRLENAHIVISGSNAIGESVSVRLENLIFDGMVDKADYPFDREGLSFDEMFGGERENERCILANWGYFELSLTGCEIMRYAAYEGPAIFMSNNEFEAGNSTISLTDCRFTDNLCYHGTVDLWHDKGIYHIDGCEFTRNTAKFAAGMILSNGKITVTDTAVYDNDCYRFLIEKYPEDMLVIEKIGREFPTYSSCGALFIGAADASVRNCTITGNRSVYGGGVGIVTPEAIPHGEKVEFIDCTIADNSAVLAGGGIFVCSYTGQTVRFINCSICGNSAPKGGVLYTMPLAPYFPDSVGGCVQFAFCTMAENSDEDGSSFIYHDTLSEKAEGSIELYGCLVLDGAAASGNAVIGAENYIATRQQALEEKTVSERDLEKLASPDREWLRPLSGSAADVSVSPQVYSLWAERFADASETRPIGAVRVETAQGSMLWWLLAIPFAAALVLGGWYVCLKRRKAAQLVAAEEAAEPEDAKSPEFAALTPAERTALVAEAFSTSGLTKKELQVASLLLVCETRREIAEQLFISEDTVKSHLSHIYKKTGVSSRQEFRSRVSRS